MAIKTVLIDDFDGTPISGPAVTTHFSLNGAMYEIDLSAENAQKLKDALAPFIKFGRKVAAGPEVMARDIAKAKTAAKRRGVGRHSNGSNDLTAIREWARASGHTLGDRGRIAAAILEAYAAVQ